MTDRITIVIRLPQELDKVSSLLSAVGRIWPGTKVDTEGPEGWVVDIPATPP